MSASATENDPSTTTTAAKTKLTDAYPRDVIIQYIFKPTMVEHPIVYVLFQYPWCWLLIYLNRTTLIILIIISYTWNCDPSPLRMPTCGHTFHYIFLFIEFSPPLLLLYLWYKRHLLRRASTRKEGPAALA